MTREPQISRDLYLATCKRRFGRSNPERMRVPVWEWMVRERLDPYFAREALKLKKNWPPGDPDWCFDRMGAPRVEMPDGRIITVAGEHEDYYDPDFCIYNDVVVQRGDDVEIYGYPRPVFPPTDFHTATLVGTDVLIIGGLGYQEERSPSPTPIFRLDTSDYHIERVEALGDSPGWIHKHRSTWTEAGGVIEVSGGEVLVRRGSEEWFRTNFDVYRLHLADRRWQCTTGNGGWRQFSVAYSEDIDNFSDFAGHGWYTGEVLEQFGHPCDLYEDDDTEEEYPDRPHIIHIKGVPVQVVDRPRAIRVTVQGVLPTADIDRLLAQLQDALRATNRTVTAVTEL